MLQIYNYIDQVCIYAIFGLALNLILGYTGVLQAAPAAFGAFGGYSVLYLTAHHVNWLLAVLVGIGFATAVGFLVGIVALYLEPLWILLLTLSTGLVIGELLSGLNVFGGSNGLQAGFSFSFLGYRLAGPGEILPLVAVLAVATFAIAWRIGESPYGRVLRGIRSDDSAVYALGKNVFSYKLTMFTLTAAFFGLAGALISTLANVASPTQFNNTTSVEIIAIVIIGGVGNVFGSVIGSAVVVLLIPFFQATLDLGAQTSANVQLIAYGAVLAGVVLFRPSGAIPEGFSVLGCFRSLAGLRSRQRGGDGGNGDLLVPAVAELRQTPAPARLRGNSEAPHQGVVLEVRELRKSFSGLTAVNGLSLELQGGKITALVGPNGAGKTTVFNLLTGALSPDSGDVLLNGASIIGLRSDQIALLGMVRSFQDIRLFGTMTVLDNVLMGVQGHPGEHLVPLFTRRRRTRSVEAAAQQIALQWLEFVGMEDVARSRVDALGYGQQKLVALARILATDAKVLLLDEPASGVDYQFLDSLLNIVTQLRDEGRTICIVEHNLDVVRQLADHICFMELGRVTAQGSFAQLTGDQRLAEAYFGGS